MSLSFPKLLHFLLYLSLGVSAQGSSPIPPPGSSGIPPSPSPTISGVATAICKPSSCGRDGTGPACPGPSLTSPAAVPVATSNADRRARHVSSDVAKRATGDLPSPGDYGNNMDTFMTTLFGQSSTSKVSLPYDVVSSSNTLAWSDSSADGLALGVEGLFGCGSIVIASRKGIWMSHHWQDGFETDSQVQADIVTPLNDGNSAMDPKLSATVANVFTEADNVKVLLLTPEAVQNVPSGLADPSTYTDLFDYQDKMDGAVKTELQSLLPGNAQFQSVTYALPQNTQEGYSILQNNKDNEYGPEASAEWVAFVNSHALGHVLAVYSPTGVSSQPAHKIYLGESITPVLEDNWSS